MSTEIHFKVGQAALRVHVAICPDTVDDEAVVGDRGLEPLQPIPWKRASSTTSRWSFEARTRHAICADGERRPLADHTSHF